MKFVNREEELTRLDGLAGNRRGGFAVVYGRRRIGKTRLLLEWTRNHDGLYTVADQSTAEIQRRYFCDSVATRLPDFDAVQYPDWRSLLTRLSREAKLEGWRGPIIIDELPYLVRSAPELPSVLQQWIDHEARAARLLVAVAGSSQRMMQGLVLSPEAPLYGRADVILQLGPIAPKYIRSVVGSTSIIQLTEFYTAWGGVPRYWELAAELKGSSSSRIESLVLDPMGPLHREPDRLLIEELPPAVELRPVLDSIGAGAHRLSEIADRIGRPATSMSRPLDRLLSMGLVKREIPFGESEKKSRRSLYKIDDPFFRLWFRVVAPYRGQLTVGTRSDRIDLLERFFPDLSAQAWEDLCRGQIPRAGSKRLEGWGVASRWWRGGQAEWDLVSEARNESRILLGEAKWSSRPMSRPSIEKACRLVASKPMPKLAAKYAGHAISRCLMVPEVAKGVPRELAGVWIVRGTELIG